MEELIKKFLEDDSIPTKTKEELQREFEEEKQKAFEERDIDFLTEVAVSMYELERGSTVQMKKELEQKYDVESQKPLKKQDLDLLGELADEIIIANRINTTPMPFEDIQRLAKERQAQKKRKTLRVCLVAASIVLLMILPLNLISHSTYGMNIFNTVVSFFRGDLFINYEVIELPTSESDEHGLRTETHRHSMNVMLLPTYLPRGFELVENDFYETYEHKIIDLLYRNRTQKLNLNIVQHKKEEVPDIFFLHLDTQNLKEKIIDGRPTFIVDEGDRYRATFKDGFVLYSIETQNVDYGELMAFLFSFR